MAWIRLTGDEEASGRLAAEFAAARKRAGRVYNIVRAMSPNPAILHQSMALYGAVMFGPSPLTRSVREMLAVVVSKRNNCVY